MKPKRYLWHLGSYKLRDGVRIVGWRQRWTLGAPPPNARPSFVSVVWPTALVSASLGIAVAWTIARLSGCQ